MVELGIRRIEFSGHTEWLYLAPRITRDGGQTEIHFGFQYQERDRFDQLMAQLRSIERKMDGFIPVVNTPLCA